MFGADLLPSQDYSRREIGVGAISVCNVKSLDKVDGGKATEMYKPVQQLVQNFDFHFLSQPTESPFRAARTSRS
jgi:hypothetical protein